MDILQLEWESRWELVPPASNGTTLVAIGGAHLDHAAGVDMWLAYQDLDLLWAPRGRNPTRIGTTIIMNARDGALASLHKVG